MKAKSKASKTQQDKDFSMLSPINESPLDLALFAIAEVKDQPNPL